MNALLPLKPTDRIRHPLDITGLARIVETFDWEAAAIASCETDGQASGIERV